MPRPACASARAPSGGVILEAFKPGTAPPDSYSVIGYTDAAAAAGPIRCHARRRPRRAPRQRAVLTQRAKRIRIGRGSHRRSKRLRVAPCPRNRYIRPAKGNELMRAETEKLVEDIKRSVGLLRRHL